MNDIILIVYAVEIAPNTFGCLHHNRGFIDYNRFRIGLTLKIHLGTQVK